MGALIEVMDVAGGGIKNAGLLGDAIDGIAGQGDAGGEGPGLAAIGAADAVNVGVAGNNRLGIGPVEVERAGVFQADAMIWLMRRRGLAGRILVGGIDISLPPTLAPIGAQMQITQPGKGHFIGIGRRDLKAQGKLIERPLPISIGALPARGDVAVVHDIQRVGKGFPAINALGDDGERRVVIGAGHVDRADVVAGHRHDERAIMRRERCWIWSSWLVRA